MNLDRFWILLPIVTALIIVLGFVSSDWILAAIHPGMVLLDVLIRMPASPVVAFTQATRANPASVLVVGSIVLSAAIWSAIPIGFVATLRRIKTASDVTNT